MTNAPLQQAIDNIYASLLNDNEDIDLRIAELKSVLGTEKKVTFEAAKLAQNSRPGRRMMQSYFKKRGLIVEFA